MVFHFTNTRTAQNLQQRPSPSAQDMEGDVFSDKGPHSNGGNGVGNGNGNGNGNRNGHGNVSKWSDSSSPGSSESGRLSVIMENGDGDDSSPSPTKPRRTKTRTARRLFASPEPPDRDHEQPPPPYSAFAGIIKPKGEKILDVRNKSQIARRGGWRRLCVLALVLIAIIVGLVVGLVVGLRNRHNSNADLVYPPSAASSATPAPGPFPAGSYSLTTFLSTADTNCTSNPSTWRCFPYVTYDQSATASMATFNWIIAANDSSPSKFSISSTDNPFSLTFDSVALELRNQGLDSEHYSFSVPMDKTVIPQAGLTDDGTLATCYYNGTTLSADLYTKQKKTYPAASASASASASTGSAPASGAFQPYPFATDIQQTISGGPNAPACFKTQNGNPMGSPITDGVSSKSGKCSCMYQNFGP